MTWNGTTITGPVLIYQDELIVDNHLNVLDSPENGTVICRSENQYRAGWHFANGDQLSSRSVNFIHFRQRRTGQTATPSVSRLTTNLYDMNLLVTAANGIWTSQLNNSTIGAIPVGIYARGGGGEWGRVHECMYHCNGRSLLYTTPVTHQIAPKGVTVTHFTPNGVTGHTILLAWGVLKKA